VIKPVFRGLVAAVALAAGCAHGGIGSPEGWSAVKSKHFTVYARYPRETQLLMRDLELAYSSLGSTFFKSVDLPRVEVVAFSPEVFEEVLGFRRNTVAVAGLPGGGAIGKDGLLLTKDDQGRPVVAEALAHLFINKSFSSAPLWFHEGFAAYVRTVEYRYGAGGQIACFGVLPGEKEPVLPLQRVLTLSWDDYDGDQARNWYRYTTRLLIDFILHGAAGKNAVRMRPLIEAVGAGKSPQETLEAAFPNVSMEVLDRKLAEHAADLVYQVTGDSPKRGLCPLPAAIAADRAVDESKPQVDPAPTQELAAVFQAMLKLPRRDGYPPWYPAEVIARAK
jgi:hypothetical protein